MKIHELLNIPEDSTPEVVRKQFKFSCPHPDRGGKVEDFISWVEAKEQYENSLVQETDLQKYIRLVTRRTIIRVNESNGTLDFSTLMTAMMKDDLKKQLVGLLNTERKQMIFTECTSSAERGIINSETNLLIISEIRRQLEQFPDAIAFIKTEIKMIKEAIKLVKSQRESDISRFSSPIGFIIE